MKETHAARKRRSGTPREECHKENSIRGGGVPRAVPAAQPIGGKKVKRETNRISCASRVDLTSSSPDPEPYGDTKRWPCVVPKINGRAQTIRSNGGPLLERRERADSAERTDGSIYDSGSSGSVVKAEPALVKTRKL